MAKFLLNHTTLSTFSLFSKAHTRPEGRFIKFISHCNPNIFSASSCSSSIVKSNTQLNNSISRTIKRTMCTATNYKFADTSAHQALPSSVKPDHYAIHLYDIDSTANTFKGLTTIDFNVLEPTDSITLNQKYITVESAKALLSVTKTESEISIESISNDDTNDSVTFKLGETVSTGDLKLTINYKGKIRTDMGGFYNASYKDSSSNLQTILCTQFEAVDARSAFPCYDEPNAKATFDVSLTIPAELEVLGNMPVLSSKTLDDGKKGPSSGEALKLVTFETTPKMSTYLLAWTIGKFDFVEGFTSSSGTKIPIRIYTVPGQEQNGEFALDAAKKAVEYLSSIFDVPYPLPKLDLVAVPAFGANAMENWGLIVFRSSALLFDPLKSDAKYKQKVAYVVSHEVAHSWFGNYCTMNWWSDLWLNESFATYVGYLCVDSMYPEWDIFTEFVSSAVQKALDLDSLRNSHPVEVQVYHAKEIDEIFDAISYLKGGSVVRMVAESVGVELFLKGVSNYLKKHAFGNAKSDDLWDAVSEVSGKDITSLVAPWIRSIGFPYLQASKTEDGLVKLTQQRFLSSGDVKPEEDQIVWWIPNESMTEKTKLVSTDRFSKLNKDTAGFYRVVYEDSLLYEIISNMDRLSSKDKIGLVADTAAGAQAGLVKTSQFLKLVSSFKEEDDYAVWMEIASRLSGLQQLFFNDSVTSSQLNRFSQDLHKSKFKSLFAQPADSLSLLDSNLRALLFSQTGTAGLEETLEFAQCSVKANNFDSTLKQGIFKTLLSNESTCTKENFDVVMCDVLNPPTIDSREIALCALGSVCKPDEFLDEILALYFSEKLPEMDYLFLTVSLVANPATKVKFWQFFKANFTKYREETAMWTLDRMIKSFLPYLVSDVLLTDVISTFDSVNTEGFEKGLRQGVDAIAMNVEWLKRDKEDIKAWLTSSGY